MFIKVKDSHNACHTGLLRLDYITAVSRVRGQPDKIRIYMLDTKEFIVDDTYLHDLAEMTNLRLDLK